MECNRIIILIILPLLFWLVYSTGCSLFQESDRFTLEEAQVLCVYWSSSFSRRDTLPAIVYRADLTDEIQRHGNFFIRYSFDGNEFKDLPLKKVFLSSSDRLVGLVLESKSLYDFYTENEFTKGGPCYEQKLMTIVESGIVYYENELEIVTADKDEDFVLVTGPKNDF